MIPVDGMGMDVPQNRLTLLSYNIQTGISTYRYSDYLTRSWQHVLPTPSRMKNLDGIARMIAPYDIVGLQEVDTGSLRSGFVDQVKYLAEIGRFPYRFDQSNRRVGSLSQHSNAVLSRLPPSRISNYKLPGLIPGRGALTLRFGQGEHALYVVIVHLSLGKRGRLRQIRFIADLVRAHRYSVVMGDLNCRSDSREMRELLRTAGLREPEPGLKTFPSWHPTRQLDHILVSPAIEVEKVSVLPHAFSDHLPVSMQILLPRKILKAA
jgi:endonuclease/exonuclease/phosphatase family metal-dependent hydrolase